MCGITSIYNTISLSNINPELIKKMNNALHHRGPDDEGYFDSDHCFFGHKRLSIIDLSSDGHQPFFSDDNRYVMVYNGEIYNYIELRDELRQKGHNFRTKTDTEVLLKSYLEWKEKCLNKLNGMFAFIIYDRGLNQLFIARDRFGIKPLYYTIINNTYYFASEIKALKIIPGIDLEINDQAVFDYFIFNRTDIAEETFYKNIHRFPKAHYGYLSKDGLKLTKWWDAEDHIKEETNDSYEEILQNVKDLFVDSVRLRMRSDVPVGVCLSGGLDSSILTGVLFDELGVDSSFKTFTTSYPGHPIDETKYVDALNKKYPFQNFRAYPTSETAFNELEKFISFYDEPVPSASPYSQYEVMKLAKENEVTVLLDGQGGDENFAGYQYFHGYNFQGLKNEKQYFKLGREILSSFKRRQEKSAFQLFAFQHLPRYIQKKVLKKQNSYLDPDFFDKYIDTSIIFNNFFSAKNLNHSLALHFKYKLEHLLHWEDRNSMAFSLESRVPYLDYRFVEYLLKVPEKHKISQGENKLLQKRSLGEYTIDMILNRKDKIGFGTPMEDWIKEDCLNKDKNISHIKYFHNKEINSNQNFKIKWKYFIFSIWRNS
jgi:asparagine synthase (glutamine-hydrolysing)